MKSIVAQIRELEGMDVAALVRRYEELHGKPPRVKQPQWLRRRCAWKLQERRFGGLSIAARRRIDESSGEIEIPGLVAEEPEEPVVARGELPGKGRHGDPPVGTVLTRVYQGHEVQARCGENGWDVGGVVYRSLSAAAKAVTGSHWNGRLFWGLSKRKGTAR